MGRCRCRKDCLGNLGDKGGDHCRSPRVAVSLVFEAFRNTKELLGCCFKRMGQYTQMTLQTKSCQGLDKKPCAVEAWRICEKERIQSLTVRRSWECVVDWQKG